MVETVCDFNFLNDLKSDVKSKNLTQSKKEKKRFRN